MKRCVICTQEAEWTWQPFGPGEESVFAAPGFHYRGFAALPCCEPCREKIRQHIPVTFSYKGRVYTLPDDPHPDQPKEVLVRAGQWAGDGQLSAAPDVRSDREGTTLLVAGTTILFVGLDTKGTWHVSVDQDGQRTLVAHGAPGRPPHVSRHPKPVGEEEPTYIQKPCPACGKPLTLYQATATNAYPLWAWRQIIPEPSRYIWAWRGPDAYTYVQNEPGAFYQHSIYPATEEEIAKIAKDPA